MATRKKILVTASICMLALLLGTAIRGSVDTSERKAFRVYGDATVLIDWANPQVDAEGRPFVTWTVTASRVCTEGWFKDTGGGRLYLDTLVLEGSGVCAERNGLVVTWDSVEEYGSQTVAVTITGGQGDFEAIGGQYTYTYTPLSTELDADGNPTKLVYSFWGAGTIMFRY